MFNLYIAGPKAPGGSLVLTLRYNSIIRISAEAHGSRVLMLLLGCLQLLKMCVLFSPVGFKRNLLLDMSFFRRLKQMERQVREIKGRHK